MARIGGVFGGAEIDRVGIIRWNVAKVEMHSGEFRYTWLLTKSSLHRNWFVVRRDYYYGNEMYDRDYPPRPWHPWCVWVGRREMALLLRLARPGKEGGVK